MKYVPMVPSETKCINGSFVNIFVVRQLIRGACSLPSILVNINCLITCKYKTIGSMGCKSVHFLFAPLLLVYISAGEFSAYSPSSPTTGITNILQLNC